MWSAFLEKLEGHESHSLAGTLHVQEVISLRQIDFFYKLSPLSVSVVVADGARAYKFTSYWLPAPSISSERPGIGNISM